MTVERTTSEVNEARQKVNHLITMGIISTNVILFAVLYFLKMPYVTSIPVAVAGAAIVSIVEVGFIRATLAKKQESSRSG